MTRASARLICCLCVLAVASAGARKPDVGFVPTPTAAVERMVEMADLRPGDVVYDLGCGDGRIVVAAAKREKIKAVGVDIDPERVAESQENVRASGLDASVQIRQADVFGLDLRDADVVFFISRRGSTRG